MTRLAEGEIEREAKRLLPRMQSEQTLLLQLDESAFGLFVPKNKWRKPVQSISSVMLHALLGRDLLRCVQAAPNITCAYPTAHTKRFYILSDAGRSWVRRLTHADTGFLEQHRLPGRRFIRDTAKANAEYQVNLAESPLGWLRKRKGPDGQPLISEAEYEAGEKLREDYTLAQLSPRVTADWSGMPIQRKTRRAAPETLALNEAVIAAKTRVEAALQAVGPGLADALIESCCLLNGLEQAEKNMGWPQRSGKVVLQIALGRLADHYGMTGSTRRARTVRLWHADPDPTHVDP